MLPPFPQSPSALTTRQIECARCRELFSIAEDTPRRSSQRTDIWQVPLSQHPTTRLRFVPNRDQVGVMTEVRTHPIQQIHVGRDWSRNYHLNCPRCGADNRNWLFVTENLQPLLAQNVIIGGIISILLVMFILISRRSLFFPDRLLAAICLVLAAILPLLIVPGQWRTLREHQLAQRFLRDHSREPASPTMRTVLILAIVLVVVIPGIRYGLVPIAREALSVIEDSTGVSGTESATTILTDQLGFLAEWFYLGSLTSIVSSVFALLGVNQILGRINNQLPRPIYANTANMVRVTLWEAKRALEIGGHFEYIQWMMTGRNDLGGIEMVGCFRDPPEYLSNGRLQEQVRVQKYRISTDRWCVIMKAEIFDTEERRPAGGWIHPAHLLPPPLLPSPFLVWPTSTDSPTESASEVVIGRIKN